MSCNMSWHFCHSALSRGRLGEMVPQGASCHRSLSRKAHLSLLQPCSSAAQRQTLNGCFSVPISAAICCVIHFGQEIGRWGWRSTSSTEVTPRGFCKSLSDHLLTRFTSGCQSKYLPVHLAEGQRVLPVRAPLAALLSPQPGLLPFSSDNPSRDAGKGEGFQRVSGPGARCVLQSERLGDLGKGLAWWASQATLSAGTKLLSLSCLTWYRGSIGLLA